jgi:hypothetical protein
LAKAEQNWPAGRLQIVGKFLVGKLHLVGAINLIAAAPVVFDKINSPAREGFGVLLFVAVTGFVPGAGRRAGAGVNSHFEAEAVNVIAQRLHVGKRFWVGMKNTVGIVKPFPAAVNDHVFITGGLHSVGRHGCGLGADDGVADIQTKTIPTVPTHRRRLRQFGVLGESIYRRKNNQRENKMKECFSLH